ncbi:MAG: MFS transporter [Flavobacteriales bacterium]|nr:MFS transporter [Flavobacteriales bacterium]
MSKEKYLSENQTGSFYSIILLILAGESIYILTYVLARIFRPTFLDVFNLTNFQLGSLFSIYGIVALISYLYGGVIADRYSPGKLMAIALFSTAIGGFVMATFPSFLVLQILYAYWGFTTVFLFWGAMIKATRLWGGGKNQGKAFGFLDGGRGIVAASMGSIGVFIFSIFLKTEINLASVVEKQEAFRYVILFSSFTVIIIGALVLYFMDNKQKHKVKKNSSINSIKNIRSVLKIKSVWLMMMIIMSAYVGYKLTDIYSLYASEVMLYSQIEAAEIGALQLYLRPLVCLFIGLLADKTSSIRWIIIGFFIMLIGALLFASGIITSSMNIIFSLSLIITAVGTYAIRALYFAVFNEGRIPLELTGTAVGIISIIGYTPDIFATPIIGYLLDTYPGIIGHQYVFMMLVIFSILGLFASIKFSKLNS